MFGSPSVLRYLWLLACQRGAAFCYFPCNLRGCLPVVLVLALLALTKAFQVWLALPPLGLAAATTVAQVSSARRGLELA